MTKKNLFIIVSNSCSRFGFEKYLDSEMWKDLYSPKYKDVLISEAELHIHLHKAICFDFINNLTYVSGKLSCIGLEFKFSHPRFKYISVTVRYDLVKDKIYNLVLAIPEYTSSDLAKSRNGSICQYSNKIIGDSALKSYFNRMYKRFDCPEINQESRRFEIPKELLSQVISQLEGAQKDFFIQSTENVINELRVIAHSKQS